MPRENICFECRNSFAGSSNATHLLSPAHVHFIRNGFGDNAISYLNVPRSVSERVQTELVRDFGGVHGLWEILFVGEDEKDGVTELVFGEHPHQLFPGLSNTLTIVRVDDEDKSWKHKRLDLVITARRSGEATERQVIRTTAN